MLAATSAGQHTWLQLQRHHPEDKAKRKRPKFIRKVKCQVCGDVANDHIHYGATVCYSCRAFFRRSVNSKASYFCSQQKQCEITPETRRTCQFCRLQKCARMGMKADWVLTEDEKKERREKAKQRKVDRAEREPDPTAAESPSSSTSTDASEVAAAPEATAALVPAASSMVQQLEMKFTNEETLFVANLDRMNKQAASQIPVNPKLLKFMFFAAKYNNVIPYDLVAEGHRTCVDRIVKLAGMIDCFAELPKEDRDGLLRFNPEMIANLRGARFLRPDHTLQNQLNLASGGSGRSVAATVEKIEYSHVFQSPWACNSTYEEKHAQLMYNLLHVELDDVTYLLMTMMALFNNRHAKVKESKRCIRNQEFFTQMLHRYLCSAKGYQSASTLLPKYVYLISELEDMASILDNSLKL